MLNRRALLQSLAATGIGTAVFHRSITASLAQDKELTVDQIKQAEWVSDLQLTDEQREEILRSVNQTNQSLADFRSKVKLPYTVPMAVHFTPTANQSSIDSLERTAVPVVPRPVELPQSDEKIAFLPVHQLAGLIRAQKLTSVRLTKIYLGRLKKYSGMLRCVVTLMEMQALEQAKKADLEIASGNYRGPLHGIPWGAKDLIAVADVPTTWGIPYHKEQVFDYNATVAERLEQAGAVLCAKLSLGALAMGDQWFEGMTRNPWNPVQGSSGSSAGSASSVVAGLVAFTLGSETLGSILSPSIRCGASSLRPTFGRVSRDGCMPLSWSMDKIGPICRSIEDCALVFDAIHGADGKDPTARNFAFNWPSKQDLDGLKIGYAKSRRKPDDEREDLALLKSLGCELVPLNLPREIPLRPFFNIIDVEAASVFDDLLRAGETEGWNSWPVSFRNAQYISAVDYVKIQRARSLLMDEFEKLMDKIDFLVNMRDLVHTNYTGHPCAVLPVGYNYLQSGGQRPLYMEITGHLNGDERLLHFANLIQSKQTAHQKHPQLDPWLAKFDAGTLDSREEPEKKEQKKKDSAQPKSKG
ncbi:MAG: amidase [Planctomycetota bacterium]